MGSVSRSSTSSPPHALPLCLSLFHFICGGAWLGAFDGVTDLQPQKIVNEETIALSNREKTEREE